MPEDPKSKTDVRHTVRLDPSGMKPSWPIVLASLEQVAGWGTFALRLGTLALIQECVRDLTARDARVEVLEQLRELVVALGHMPLEE